MADGGGNPQSRPGGRPLRAALPRAWRGILAALWIGWSGALAGAPADAAKRPRAEVLLRRADQVRNPYVGTALDLELSVASRATGRTLRRSSYVLITRRDRTLLLIRQEDRAAPGALLIADGAYWLLLPGAERPVELALRHVVAGDLSHAGFLRVSLWAGYEARFDGAETIDGAPCWRLELTPRKEPALFGRVRYWVARQGFLPTRIEFYDPAGKLLKTARFVSYRKTGVGLRPARIEIEDAGRPRETATLSLGEPQGVATSTLEFDLDALAALRSAARRLALESEGPVTGRRLVQALAASPRTRAEIR